MRRIAWAVLSAIFLAIAAAPAKAQSPTQAKPLSQYTDQQLELGCDKIPNRNTDEGRKLFAICSADAAAKEQAAAVAALPRPTPEEEENTIGTQAWLDKHPEEWRKALSLDLCQEQKTEQKHLDELQELKHDAQIGGVVSLTDLKFRQDQVAASRWIQQKYRKQLRDGGARPIPCKSKLLTGDQVANEAGAYQISPTDYQFRNCNGDDCN